jgi:cell division protein FtsZ
MDDNRMPGMGLKTMYVGVGDCGLNSIRRIDRQALPDVRFAAVHTDPQWLRLSPADTNLRIGKRATGGFGSGGYPPLGRKAAEESADDLYELLHGNDLVFVVGGFGGGTATGAFPVIASMLYECGVIALFVATTPFAFEGLIRNHTAQEGLQKMRELGERARDVLVIPNAGLIPRTPRAASCHDGWGAIDRFIQKGVQKWLELAAKKNHPRLEPEAVRSLFAEIEDPIPHLFL